MKKAARRIVQKLRRHGHEAYFAGGWVRDHLLGIKPSDIDIATSALPEEIRRLFTRSRNIGAQFGVVQVSAYGRDYEVATFRSEGDYLDGRHPSEVHFSRPREDAQRRDFTINGLFYDPVNDTIIDYVRGEEDLQRRIIRTIGAAGERFEEDKLRMLRAIRLACALNFEIAKETWQAIENSAPRILQVSWERIRDEVLKIVSGPARARGLQLLVESGLIKMILPEVDALRGVQQPPEFHPEGDVFAHTQMALGMLRNPSPVLALGTLLHDVGKPATYAFKERIRFDGHVELGAQMAGEICLRLKMSKEEAARVVALVEHHLRFLHVKEMRQSTLIRFLRMPYIEDHLELHRVDCLSSHGNLEAYFFCRQKLREHGRQPSYPAPLITGRDLIEMGYRPGPIFREILSAIEDQQIEKTLRTRDQALCHIRKTFPLPLNQED